MKRCLTIPALSMSLGLVGFALRFWQNRTGFEADTGLPIPGNIPAMLLPVLLLASAVILLLAARTQPKGPVKQSFFGTFRTEDTKILTILVLGVFLMAASGVMEILSAVLESGPVEYLTADGLVLVSGRAATDRSVRLMGIFSAAAAVCVFPAVLACRRETVKPLPVLAAHVLLLIRLILAYRIHSVNPVLADYYVELLSLILLILGLYRLSGFAVECGAPRFYSVYTGLTVVLALTLLADGISAPALLALGGATVLIGFQLLLQPAETAQNTADGPESCES